MNQLFTEDGSIARDRALANLETYRAEIVAAAKASAYRLALKNGSVTSTEVLANLRALGYTPDAYDKRFMGCVFNKGWVQDGMKPVGSHKRRVPVWRLAPPPRRELP